jgi:predicted phosphoribosyltransferase
VPFKHRRQAGKKLAQALLKYRAQNPVVLALPRGGVPVAAEVAAALGAPLEVVLVRKIGVPHQPELAMGAVADAGEMITVQDGDVLDHYGVDRSAFEAARDREVAEIQRRRQLYRPDCPEIDLNGRTVLLIDDGIATGSTIRAAVQAVWSRKAAKIVIAAPVASTQSIASLRESVDEFVVLESYADLGAIGFYYKDFAQVSDAEVMDTLRQFREHHQDPAPHASSHRLG